MLHPRRRRWTSASDLASLTRDRSGTYVLALLPYHPVMGPPMPAGPWPIEPAARRRGVAP